MTNYIDGFVFPIRRDHVETYKTIVEQVADIWKEHGALSYQEYVGEDLNFEGTRTFPESLGADEDETIIFGWVIFDSRKARDLAHKKVAADSRMTDLVAPLMDPARMIFDASRMAHGGFQSLIKSS